VSTQSSNRKVANSLLALSSAAIVAVYSAGYERTRASAQRFSVQADARRPAPISPPAAASPPVASSVPSLVPAPAPAAEARPVKPPRKAKRDRIDPSSPAPIAAVTAAPPASPEPTPQAIQLPPPPAPEPPPASPQYRDGTYYGWGTSRHGDIQAAVVIESGRIASATIAQCLTRYSCSVIARLPPQVAERQSPEVDYVSGATQSTNAFYYAVVEALGQAKAK